MPCLRREILSLSLVTRAMIKRVHAFNILSSIFRNSLVLRTELFSLAAFWRKRRLLCIAHTAHCIAFYSGGEQNILLQQHYWHCSFDLIYLWADNTHILYHFMHANGMQCENVNNRIEQTNNENEKMSAKKLIEIIMKLMRFSTFMALALFK